MPSHGVCFAYHIFLVDETARCVDANLQACRESFKSKKIRISRSKTECMNVSLAVVKLPVLQEWPSQSISYQRSKGVNYLGSIVSKDRELKAVVTQRV